jgi:pyridoxamine 5'-phosphate oxidase-like protein
MKWSEIEEREPALGAVARQKLIEARVLLIGTTRRDGTARISGVEPLVLDGTLWLSMMTGSTKTGDLRRDPRILLHSIVTGPEAAPELKVRGTAREEHDPAAHQRYAAEGAATLGWQPAAGRFALFAVDVEEVTYIGYDPETGGQHVARWPAGTEYLRPATTPTSLGPPQPVQRLLTGR